MKTTPLSGASTRTGSALLAVALVVLGLLPTACTTVPDRGGATAAVRSVLPALGVDAHLENLSDSRRHALFARLSGLGATWVRVGAPWYAIQPEPGVTSAAELATVERIVSDARSLGLRVVLIADQAPDWAGGGSATASDPAAYGAFLGTLAGHLTGRSLGGDAVAFELMNEPDGAQTDGRPWATPEQYATAGCAAYRAIKARDPGATVLAGSLDVTDWAPWLRRALRAGLGGCFDALSAHPYGELSVLDDIRATARAGGRPDVDIWVTEFGYSTCDDAFSGCVSRDGQADLLVRRLTELGQNYPWVPVAIIYEAGDEPANPGAANEKSFGLFTETGAHKPAVASVRALYRGVPR